MAVYKCLVDLALEQQEPGEHAVERVPLVNLGCESRLSIKSKGISCFQGNSSCVVLSGGGMIR